MRDPSIHISRHQLAFILSEVLEESGVSLRNLDLNDLTTKLVSKAKTFSLSHRSITVTNDKMQRTTDKIKASSRSNAGLFSEMLVLIRRTFKHRNVSPIKIGTKEYLEHKEYAGLATEFCNEFGLELKGGYKIYIELHLKHSKTYRPQMFKYNHNKIINLYEAQTTINGDLYPGETKAAHDYYCKTISERIGFSQGYEQDVEQYVFFIELTGEAKRLGISSETWIAAQFNGFDWVSAIPTPGQMVGSKAMQRVQKYCFQNSIRVGANKKSPIINFSKIKKIG